MIGAVLFDIDGTLIDSNDLHVEAWHQIFAEAGHPVERQRIHDQIGKGGDNLVPALLPTLNRQVRQALADGHGRLFKLLFLRQAKPFLDARALLERTHAAGRRVVLASSASQEELDHYVDLLEVRPIVSATTSIDDVATSKPAPDIFAVALRKAGVPAAEALAVGDTPYDILAAAGAGIATVALLSGGFRRDVLESTGAIEIYQDAADLLANFDRSALAR